MLSPIAVPSFFEGLDLQGRGRGKTPQRQNGGPDRHAGGRGTMSGLAMRTRHHGWEDLPRLAEPLEGGIELIAETEEGVHGHGWLPHLPHDRDQFREPDLVGIARRHRSPLPSAASCVPLPTPTRLVDAWQASGDAHPLDIVVPQGAVL